LAVVLSFYEILRFTKDIHLLLE